jgi:eukaryotic-like serine/threonine-protein kinase
MAIPSGTKFGSYEVLSQIGAGGMGEVYQAHDTKLGRDVAIKVLPEAFAHDADRLSRFQREAKLLASLNHTNNATIHDIEDSNGTSNPVMELVPGETLQERIRSEGAEAPRALSVCTIPGWSRRNPGRCPGLVTSGIFCADCKIA